MRCLPLPPLTGLIQQTKITYTTRCSGSPLAKPALMGAGKSQRSECLTSSLPKGHADSDQELNLSAIANLHSFWFSIDPAQKVETQQNEGNLGSTPEAASAICDELNLIKFLNYVKRFYSVRPRNLSCGFADC